MTQIPAGGIERHGRSPVRVEVVYGKPSADEVLESSHRRLFVTGRRPSGGLNPRANSAPCQGTSSDRASFIEGGEAAEEPPEPLQPAVNVALATVPIASIARAVGRLRPDRPPPPPERTLRECHRSQIGACAGCLCIRRRVTSEAKPARAGRASAGVVQTQDCRKSSEKISNI